MDQYRRYSATLREADGYKPPRRQRYEELRNYPTQLAITGTKRPLFSPIFRFMGKIAENYAKRTATSPRNGKNMKNLANIRTKWLLPDPNSRFSALFLYSEPKTGGKSKRIQNLNKGLQPTTHKLSAMHNELLATHQSGIVRGSKLNPDVRQNRRIKWH